jgi:hypothetical protein
MATRRFYQAGHHTAEKATKCPEPLCPTSVLPTLERCVPSPRKALPFLHRSYGLMCHSRWALLSFGIKPRPKSLCRLYQPCCPRELPDVISESLSLDAGSPAPAVHRVLSPVSSTVSSAFPTGEVGRLSASIPRLTTPRRGVFRGCRYFVMFRPPSLLAPQIVPTAANNVAGQPGLLRPGLSCFVTSARTGYANRPNTGN